MMNAAQRAALEYSKRFVVIPANGKIPVIKGWTKAPHATPADIAGWTAQTRWTAQNIQIRTGRDSGNLFVLDIDWRGGYDAFRAALPDLSKTYTVATGSGQGWHAYFTADILPDNIQAMKIAGVDKNNLEIKAEGKLVVAPPSIHPDTGKPYTVYIEAPIKHLTIDELQQLVNWIRSHQTEKERRQSTRQPITFTGNSRVSEGLNRAIVAALPDYQPPTDDGWMNGHCILPGHDDRNPSAGYNIKSGVYHCFSCGDLPATEFAECLNIDWRSIDQTKPPRQARRSGGSDALLMEFPEPAPEKCEPLSDTVILEIAPTFTPGTATLTRWADELKADGKLPSDFCYTDLRKLTQEAGYSMSTNTFNASSFWFFELNCQKSHTEKKGKKQYDFFELLPSEERKKRLKAAIWTRLIQKAFPESDLAAHLIEFYPRMIIDTLNTGANTTAIVTALNQVLPLPEGSKREAEEILKTVEAEYRAIVKTLSDETITRLDPADLPERARSKPNTYLDVLRRERYKPFHGQQVSGRQRGILSGIRDPRQRSRKEKALGIAKHEVTSEKEIQTIAAVKPVAIRNCAHPLRLIAKNRAGAESATLLIADTEVIDTPHAAAFVTTQRSAGNRVYVELQERSRIEVNAMPERVKVKKEKPAPALEHEPISRQPEILQNAAKNHLPKVPSRTAPEERPDEVPGVYTDHWLKFHILRRLKRDARGFYINPATGEIIPNDLTGSLAELVEALTGYRLTERQEQSA